MPATNFSVPWIIGDKWGRDHTRYGVRQLSGLSAGAEKDRIIAGLDPDLDLKAIMALTSRVQEWTVSVHIHADGTVDWPGSPTVGTPVAWHINYDATYKLVRAYHDENEQNTKVEDEQHLLGRFVPPLRTEVFASIFYPLQDVGFQIVEGTPIPNMSVGVMSWGLIGTNLWWGVGPDMGDERLWWSSGVQSVLGDPVGVLAMPFGAVGLINANQDGQPAADVIALRVDSRLKEDFPLPIPITGSMTFNNGESPVTISSIAMPGPRHIACGIVFLQSIYAAGFTMGGAVSVDVEATKYLPFKNSTGAPVFSDTGGNQVNDPFS